MARKMTVAKVSAYLSSFEAGSVEQQAYAVELLSSEKRLSLIGPAIEALAGTQITEARPYLLSWYDHMSANDGRRDDGAHLRTAILRALRQIARPEDTDLLEQAAQTVQFAPPGHSEVASMLRATALLILDEIDSDLAAHYAVQLLFGKFTEKMSGEPALTAARVLASHRQSLPLWAYLNQNARPSPDVAGECLRAQNELPLPLVRQLAARFGPDGEADPEEMVEAAWVDLLMGHVAHEELLDNLFQTLWSTQSLQVLRYGATALAAARDELLHDLLLDLAEQEEDAERITVLLEAVSLLPDNKETRTVLLTMEHKLGNTRL